MDNFDPFENRRAKKSFFSQRDVEEFERYWHLKYDAFKHDIHDQECVKPHVRLWQIKYVLVGEQKFIGAATVAAPTPKQAEVIFLNESNFNGFREFLKITEIQEILLPLVPCMLAESYTGILDKGYLEKYAFATKEYVNTLERRISMLEAKTNTENTENPNENEGEE